MKRTVERNAHEPRHLGFERLVFFSDAVFAIAITLLVLDLKLPPEAHGVIAVGALIPKLVGFIISFLVIGIYWLAHHRLFETIKGQDNPLRVANLIFLAAVAFLPFPTTLVAEGPAVFPVVFYAISVAAVGLLLCVLTLVARRPRLLRAGETRGGTARFLIRSLAPPIYFLATAGVGDAAVAVALPSGRRDGPGGTYRGTMGRCPAGWKTNLDTGRLKSGAPGRNPPPLAKWWMGPQACRLDPRKSISDGSAARLRTARRDAPCDDVAW